MTSLRDGAEITLAGLASGTMQRDLRREMRAMSATEGDILFHYVFGAALDFQARANIARIHEGDKVEVPDVSRGVRLILSR